MGLSLKWPRPTRPAAKDAGCAACGEPLRLNLETAATIDRRCPQCGAPVPEDAGRCPRCNAVIPTGMACGPGGGCSGCPVAGTCRVR